MIETLEKIDQAIAYSQKCIIEWQGIKQKSHLDRRAGMIADTGIDYHEKRILRLQKQKEDFIKTLEELQA